jgi:hypothetical protein
MGAGTRATPGITPPMNAALELSVEVAVAAAAPVVGAGADGTR